MNRMNWLDPPAEPPETGVVQDPESPSEANLNYWTMRLTPLHDPAPGYSWTRPSSSVDPSAGKDMVFVACNRVGTEEGTCSWYLKPHQARANVAGTKFIGTSCVMTMSSSPSRIELVEVCNISEERVMIATVA
jgi:protein N-terminal amidase